MRVLARKFYREPIFALAVVQAAAAAVALKVSKPAVQAACAIVIGVCVVAQRQLVTPNI